MEAEKTNTSIRVVTTVSFLVMVIVNVLAETIPINGQGTGQVSDSYKNLFAPTGLTFAIWGLIYFLLAGYTAYQLGFFNLNKRRFKTDLFEKVGLYFSISSIANATWIFSWHYHLIALSMLLMIIILVCLILIVRQIKEESFSLRENIFIRFPFSVYFGWITVATIANATTLFVSLGWDRFGISEPTWTVMIIAVGLAIGIVTMLRNRDIAYGLVIIWAYAGIFIKHTSASGFAGQYPVVITTVTVCIVLLLIGEVYIIISNRRT